MPRGRKSLSLSEEQLAEIEKLASLQFTVADIAAILAIDAAALERDAAMKGSSVQRAVHTGRLRGEAVVRAALLKRARDGDLAAQKEYLRLVEARRMLEASGTGKSRER